MRTLSLTPAYGRDYKSKKEVSEAWESGSDFKIEDFKLSGYVNKAQTACLVKNGVTHLEFRFKKAQNVFLLRIEE